MDGESERTGMYSPRVPKSASHSVTLRLLLGFIKSIQTTLFGLFQLHLHQLNLPHLLIQLLTSLLNFLQSRIEPPRIPGLRIIHRNKIP